MALSPGSRLGPYEILDAIGVGGMGEVYRARDTRLNRDIALKVLPALVADDPERLARFHREAQVLASLNHPHIAQIHGFEDAPSAGAGQPRGPHALVMELVEGPTLADRIAEGPIPLADALAIARQIAEALEAAHEKGIVHRDLKPANVKVRPDGTVKVLDFGLAKALGPDGSGASGDVMNSPTLTARSTQLGMILGTAAYMAPEQAKGRAVDKRADIWAFGVVLFEMLSGQRAFKGDDVSDVLAAVLRQEIDWSDLPKDTPPRVKRLLQRCLARDPKQRLRDIGDAFLEIDAPDEPASATAAAAVAPAPRPGAPGRWLPWAIAAVAVVASTAWALWPAPAPPPPIVTRARVVLKDFAAFVDLSHDGTRLAYAVAGGPNSAYLALRSMDQFGAEPIPGGDGGAFPVFSPDGQWIAYDTLDTPRKIKKIPVTGGTSITLCDGDFFSGGDWGADDAIVFSGPKGLMRVSAAGGTPETLTTVDAAKKEVAHVRPQFLPGGRQLLFTVNGADGPHFALFDLKRGGYQIVAKGGLNGRYVASGHLTYVRDATLFALPFDLAHLAVVGQEVPVVEGISTNGPDGTADYTVSDSGLLVYSAVDSSSHGTTLAWVDRKGTTTVLLGQSTASWGTGRLSPDGRHVANGIDGASGRDIWTLDVERGTTTRLTFDGGADFPLWTPDGKRIVYSATVGGKAGLYTVLADGSGKPQLLLATDSPATPSSFTSDGRTLIFDQTAGGRRQINVVEFPLAGGAASGPHPLHEASSSESNGQVSPDGRWIAYESLESGTHDVYLQPFPGPGAKARVSAGGGYSSRWSHDGRTLYYWANQPPSRFEAVTVQNGVLGAPEELFQVLSGTTWDVTPTADRFLIERTTGGTGSTLATVTNWFAELKRRAPVKGK